MHSCTTSVYAASQDTSCTTPLFLSKPFSGSQALVGDQYHPHYTTKALVQRPSSLDAPRHTLKQNWRNWEAGGRVKNGMRCDAAGIRALLSLPQQIWHQLLPNAPLFCFNIGWNKRSHLFLSFFPILSILSPFLFVVVAVGESFAESRGGVSRSFALSSRLGMRDFCLLPESGV